MKAPVWLRDTIARRFAITVVFAVLVMVALLGLFVTLGGVWALPPLERTGLLNEAADMVHIIGAAPAPLRQSLAEAASQRRFRVIWYDPASLLATLLDRTPLSEDSPQLQRDLRLTADQSATVFSPEHPLPVPPMYDPRLPLPSEAYALAVRYADGSWLLLTAADRVWGLALPERLAIWIAFLLISVTVVSAVTTRHLSWPIKRLADDVRLLGINHHAPTLTERGPEELRGVIGALNAMHTEVQTFIAHRMAMLAAVSHDLRTPLTRMRLRGEFIEDDGQRAKLFRDVDEMQAMIDGALAFFRDDADEEEATAFDLTGVLRTIANDYADQGIEIEYVGPPHIIYTGRPFALKRALTNLVENAIRYGTPPVLTMRREEKAITVTVLDNGPGIPEAALEQVFTPFYRLETSRNRATGGVGLGLAAARAIVRGHGGDITLVNRAVGGLEARVILPIVATAHQSRSLLGLK